MGLRGLAIDKTLGWDLTLPSNQEWVLDELAKFPPELLIVCPPCTDAGGWFNLNKYYMDIAEYLRKKKELKLFKEFTKKLIRQQLSLGGRFVFEHPVGSEVWHDPDFKQRRNDLTSFVLHMCCFDLHLPATSTKEKQLIRKGTRLLLSHADMRNSLERHCPGDSHPDLAVHATVAGSHPGVGRVNTHAGKYTPAFVKAMLDAVPALRTQEVLMLTDVVHNTHPCHEVLAADEEQTTDESLVQIIRKLHNNLGHPSSKELVRVLRHGQASDRAIALASKFVRPACEAQKGPAVANPAQVQQVTVFNHKIGIDVKNLPGWQTNQKIAALNIVDYASNFQMMLPFFERETSTVLRNLLNDRWLSWAGPPKEIVMDPARTKLGKALTEPCELEGSHVSITAAGAHWQLGKVEVHGGLFCQMLERVLQERNPKTKDEWLDCVRQCHIKNSTIMTHGFTPSQVVFGMNPDIPGELLNEPQQVIPCTAGLLETSVEPVSTSSPRSLEGHLRTSGLKVHASRAPCQTTCCKALSRR